ncbi:hypothetical protein BC834DRAFT_912506, partial [Gloeopeniophorella convolvens]
MRPFSAQTVQHHHGVSSPALAASPHLFTPPLPFRDAFTPGISPIDRSPRPRSPRNPCTPLRNSSGQPFLEKLLHARNDSDDDDCPLSSFFVHLGCTSTPLRATPAPSVSPFSSPPLSCSRVARPVPSSLGVQSPAISLKRSAPVELPSRPESKPHLPSLIPIHSDFPGFYRRFPIIPPVLKVPSGCILNPPRDAHDLYTPRLVRGTGHAKVGLCPICACAAAGKVWLSTKFSAYK